MRDPTEGNCFINMFCIYQATFTALLDYIYNSILLHMFPLLTIEPKTNELALIGMHRMSSYVQYVMLRRHECDFIIGKWKKLPLVNTRKHS